MTVEQLTNVLYAQPFRPFTLHICDGRTFLVKHPGFISRSTSGRAIIVDGEERASAFSIPLAGKRK